MFRDKEFVPHLLAKKDEVYLISLCYSEKYLYIVMFLPFSQYSDLNYFTAHHLSHIN